MSKQYTNYPTTRDNWTLWQKLCSIEKDSIVTGEQSAYSVLQETNERQNYSYNELARIAAAAFIHFNNIIEHRKNADPID